MVFKENSKGNQPFFIEKYRLFVYKKQPKKARFNIKYLIDRIIDSHHRLFTLCKTCSI